MTCRAQTWCREMKQEGGERETRISSSVRFETGPINRHADRVAAHLVQSSPFERFLGGPNAASSSAGVSVACATDATRTRSHRRVDLGRQDDLVGDEEVAVAEAAVMGHALLRKDLDEARLSDLGPAEREQVAVEMANLALEAEERVADADGLGPVEVRVVPGEAALLVVGVHVHDDVAGDVVGRLVGLALEHDLGALGQAAVDVERQVGRGLHDPRALAAWTAVLDNLALPAALIATVRQSARKFKDLPASIGGTRSTQRKSVKPQHYTHVACACVKKPGAI